MKTATATSIGSAMFLAYVEAGETARILTDGDYAEFCAAGQHLPRIPALIIARDTTWEVRPIRRGRLCRPSLIIHLAGDALSDVSP